MADQMIPEVEVQLDKKRHFRVSMGALLRFKAETGREPLNREVMQQIAEDLKNKILTRDIFVLFWAALRHEDKTLTIEQVEDMIYPGNLLQVTEKFLKAFEAANPAAETGGGKVAVPLAEKPPAG